MKHYSKDKRIHEADLRNGKRMGFDKYGNSLEFIEVPTLSDWDFYMKVSLLFATKVFSVTLIILSIIEIIKCFK